MQDFAGLAFNIDSTPLSQAGSALSSMATNARLADTNVQSFSQAMSLASTSVNSFSSGIGIGSSQLSLMAASLQLVVTQLQSARAAVDGTTASFNTFATARDRVEALSGVLGTGVVALEAYAATASKLNMTSIETAGSLQRVTAAIEAQTVAGRQLREVMSSYGVNFSGATPANADQMMNEFIRLARTYRPTPENIQTIQQVTGPLGVDALTSILHPGYEPVQERVNRMHAEGVSRQVAQSMEDSTRVIRDLRGKWSEWDDLSGSYNLGRLSQSQMRELLLGMPNAPSSAAGYENQLSIMRYLASGNAPTHLRNAAELGHIQIGSGPLAMTFGPSQRMVNEAYDANPVLMDRNTWGQAALRFLYSNMPFVGDAVTRDMPIAYAGSPQNMSRNQNVLAQAMTRADRSSLGWWGGNYAGSDLGEAPGLSPLGLYGYGLARSALGYDTNLETLKEDTRPEDPLSIINRRMGEGTLLAGYGYQGLLRSAQAQRQLLTLTGRPGDPSQALGNLQRILGADIGTPLYRNMVDITERQQRDAMIPGAELLNQGSMDAWLRSVPLGERARAEQLMRFAAGNGVSVQAWADRGLSPSQLLSGMLRDDMAGVMSHDMISSFNRIQANDREGFMSGLRENYAVFGQAQTGMRDGMGGGQLNSQANIAYWQAYEAAIRSTKNEEIARAQALDAMNRAVERQITQSTQTVASLREQNDQQERNLSLLRAAGSDPVARRGAIIQGQLEADSAGISPELRGAWMGERARSLGVQAETFGNNQVAQVRQQLDDQRQLLSVAGARADVITRLNDALQTERSFDEAIAQATKAAAAGHTEALQAVQRHLREVQQLKAEYQEINRLTAVLQFSGDLSRRADQTRFLSGLTPEQRRVIAPIMPQMDNINPGAFMGGTAAERAAPWMTQFEAASAATGGRLPPQFFAALGMAEGSLLPDPAGNGTHAGMMQFSVETGRRYGLKIGDGVDERRDPALAIPAAGRYFADIMNRRGIGEVTSFDQILPALREYGTYGPTASPSAQNDAYLRASIEAGTYRGRAQWVATSDAPDAAALRAAASRSAEATRGMAVTEAGEASSYAQAQRAAELRMILMGGGDLGRQIARAGVLDPRSTIPEVEARGRITDIMGSQSLSIAARAVDLRQQADDVKRLGDAWKESREAGESFDRHMANEGQIRVVDALIKRYPELTAELTKFKQQLQDLNPELDRLAANQVTANFWQQQRQDERNNQLLKVDVDAGPFATAERLGRERAAIRAKWIAEDSKGAVTFDEANTGYQASEVLKQQAEDVRNVRMEFQRMEQSSLSAFEATVLGGGKASDLLRSLAQDIERFGLRMVERPIMKGLESAADSAFSWIGSAIGGLSLFGSDGIILSGGQPMRFASNGMLLTQPTTFMASGGTVTGGEVDYEAIFPLARDATGNLGIRVSGGGSSGHTIQINAPITVSGGVAKDGKMDGAAMAGMQKQFEAMFTKSVRNVLANERRDGGDLYLG